LFSLKPFLKKLEFFEKACVFDQTFSEKVCAQAFFEKACETACT
jgi:hypothetical protein